MNALIIDIRETSLRAVFRNDAGVLEYSRTFDFEPLKNIHGKIGGNQETGIQDAESDNPYFVGSHNLWEFELKDVLKKIRSEVSTSIDTTHLIIPPYEVITAIHQLPKMSRQDAEKLIGRKISAASKEESPPFSIIPGASDQKTQTWHSLYIPSSTLKLYRKAFAFSKLRLTSITTPVNAMLNAFQSVREAIFTTHAVFEIRHGFVEAYYISGDGILYFERLPCGAPATTPDGSEEESEKVQKFRLFKILNTIFRINSNYQAANPEIPVQMGWVCGLEGALEEIAIALKEAMGVEVGIAPALPTGLLDESGYVPLAGFSAALQKEAATFYSAPDIFHRFALRKRSGFIIYAVASIAALLTFTLTERDYRKLRTQVQRTQQAVTPKQNQARAAASAAYTKNLESLKNVTSRQFIFYNLFRELANSLPDGVFLENLEFRLKDGKGLLDITAIARLSDKTGENRLLSKLMEMFDRSPTLRSHREPAITVFTRDKERFLKITVTSEVDPFDTTK